MAVTLDSTDFTTIDDAEAIAGWNPNGSINMEALDTTSQVEGSNCIETRVNSGVGSIVNNHGTGNPGGDITGEHLFFWVKLSQSINTKANGGTRLRISSSTEGTTNFGEWDVYGSDLQVVVYNGWLMVTVDPLKPFDAVNGTPPAINSIASTGCRLDFLSGNGKALATCDLLKFGNFLEIRGGTTGDRGTFAEIATDDESSALGLVRPLGGAFFTNCELQFGDDGTGTSFFEDSNEVLFFEDLPMSAALYKIKHTANSTGTNHVQFGSSSGSGVDKEGTGGIVVKSAGTLPFRIEAIDANIDVAAYFGCGLTGPTAIFADAMRSVKVEDNGTGFTTITRDANGGLGVSNPDAMPSTQAIDDAIYFAHDERFYNLSINLITAKGGTWTGTWEYSDGVSSFASLTDVTDGTSNFATTGSQTVDWAIPDDWVVGTVDSVTNKFWIRFKITSFTSSGTTPVIESTPDLTTVNMAGDIRLEDAAVEMIGCTLTQMGSVRVRSGAFLKKTLITDSVVPAKHAALDLGSADPTADTVRDLTIQNCSKGILLKGSGNTTYNLRNIQFAGNTNDIRVDFDSGDTVTINILEDGDIPTIDNVNSSTVNVVSAISVDVHVKDRASVDIPNAQVYIQRSSPTALTSGAGNNAGDGDLVVTETIEADQPPTGFLSVLDISLNTTLGYRYASHDGANTFTFPTSVTGAATSAGTATTLISTSTNFLTADIEEGDTIRNTSTGGFAVVDEIVDADNIVTTALDTGIWGNTDNFSVHDLATTLVSGTDTVDAPLFNGQTDANGDITTLSYDKSEAPTTIKIRVSSNQGATKYIMLETTGTITTSGFTLDVTLDEDTVAE